MVTEVCAPHKSPASGSRSRTMPRMRAWSFFPGRRAGRGAGELLHWLLGEVVADRAWPCGRRGALGPPASCTGTGDHGDTLPVPDPLGGDRVAGLAAPD